MIAKPWWVMSSFLALSLAIAAGSESVEARDFQARVIYGEDNRLDLYEVQSSDRVKLAESTVALIYATNLVKNGSRFDVTARKLGEEFRLCPEERFFDQPSGAFCSGSLVGDDLILTAGHCIQDENDCKGTKFVFDYSVEKAGKFPESVPEKDVVGCKAIVAHKFERAGADFSLIRLDRKITDRDPLPINRSNDLKDGDAIGVIGHPSGLPTKVAYGAKVRSFAPIGFFLANLDTYGGNSGSAVFNEKTGKIEGVLVRGEQDYQYDFPRQCAKSFVCADAGCSGESVTKINEVAPFIP